jgi:peptidoglycan/xylan/chitin deacetylase (PgdA/CDA1 family)
MKAKRIVPDSKSLYLTFDDGPVSSTDDVLKILDRHKIKATFFVVAQTAKKNQAILRNILAAGHSIGNHSLDHSYSHFFKGKQSLLQWIKSSEEEISSLIEGPTVGFRPPAGVRTPELHQALSELQMPLILWRQRFFDTIFPFTFSKARRSLKCVKPGSIILLHDRQDPRRLPLFF